MSILDSLKALFTPVPQVRADASDGNGIYSGQTYGYEAASSGRRTEGWNPGNDSANALLFGSADTLRARSRDMCRKNAWAANAVATLSSELIGSGIKPKSQHKDPKVADALQQSWLTWTDDCDANGTQDFYGLQGQIISSVAEGGEVFVRLRTRRPEDNLTVPLQIQVLEAEHCPMWLNKMTDDGNVVKSGVEFDQIGRRVAYWLYPIHPGEFYTTFTYLPSGNQPVRVPAFLPDGTPNCLHIFDPVRPGQIRGEPWLARILTRIYDYDQYSDAELVRKKTAAMYAGFVTQNDDNDPALGNVSNTLPDGAGDSANLPPGVSFFGVEPGTFTKLNPGEDITFSTPADVGAGFEPFNRSCLLEISAGMRGLPFELLTGDYSKTNFSNVRAGLLAFRRKCTKLQFSIIVFQLCRPLWQAWTKAAVIGGEISASDYAKNIADYRRVKWIPDAWPWVDPAKDLAAAKDTVRCGFGSRAGIVSGMGYDVEEIDREIAADNDRADDLKLIFDSDPRQTANNGARPAPNNPSDPEGLQDAAPPAAPAPPAKPSPKKFVQ